MITRMPVDSAEARERREAAAEAVSDQAQADREHAASCRRGWLGFDDEGRPRPCGRCRPHLLDSPCRTCGIPPTTCGYEIAHGRGRCCQGCDHRGPGVVR